MTSSLNPLGGNSNKNGAPSLFGGAGITFICTTMFMSFFAGEFMPMVIGYAPFNVDEASSLRIVSVIAALAGLIMLIQLPKCRRFMYVAFTIMVLLYVRQVASVVFYATSAPRLLQSISPFFIALSVLMYVLYAAVIVIAGRNLAKTLKS